MLDSPALFQLLNRASVPPKMMRPPAPDAASIETAVSAALRAPDHGGLRPWRFFCIEGAARLAWGTVLAQSLLRRDPTTTAERLELERERPLRAPMVIAAGAALRHDHKVPAWEQEATAAAGIMNFMNALDAQGFGAMWLSSAALHDEAVKRALGLEPRDALLGWIYAGTPDARARPRPVRAAPGLHMRMWQPLG